MHEQDAEICGRRISFSFQCYFKSKFPMAQRDEAQMQLVVRDPHAAAIAQGIPVNVVHDEEMRNGGNGQNHGPIIVEQDDRLGPTADAPTRLFYQHAPQYHWQRSGHGAVCAAARHAASHCPQDGSFGPWLVSVTCCPSELERC